MCRVATLGCMPFRSTSGITIDKGGPTASTSEKPN
jgi:hypothetical protein